MCNLILWLVITVFIVVQLLRKSKLSKLSWFSIIQLNLIAGLTGMSQVLFATKINTMCEYGLKTVYGLENIILFNLAALVGYKVYRVCFDMAEFTKKCTLPSVNGLNVR